MKKISMLLCLVLALSMLLCLTGCSSEKDALVGTWRGEIEMKDVINEAIGADEEIGKYIQIDTFVLQLELVFNEDGTYSMTGDRDALMGQMDGFMADLTEGMTAYFADMMKAQGLTDVTVEEFLAAAGMTMEDLIAEAFSEEMINEMVDEMFVGLDSEGNFDAKDGKLFMSDGLDYAIDKNVYETYTLDGETLTLLEYVAEDATEEDQTVYPMVFTKQ